MALTVSDVSIPLVHKIIEDTDSNSTAQENVAGTSGALYSIDIDNTANGAASYVKLHDGLPDGGIVVGTTEPDWIFRVGASTTANYLIPDGIPFSTALNMWTVIEDGTGGTTSPSSAVTVQLLVS
jgi:hypothetical protein